ncbi:uncharacterized protein BO96DRAFT_410876 [Aspergillus niger CBS 101883]|uniref:uncharacterized protein n=1 Tax=Aspergillus lacticoffeatus (strain CBS 101883) TaxID=1450533 RepID=UPI000D7F6573|nr:uncharacterized protein BO96DRAFT_410876 [Aspergillus niger CBS 101883]PYH57987.1 hypothetical protein BO96DRAFT_410876 [Aspergillus niger CBS 101883]
MCPWASLDAALGLLRRFISRMSFPRMGRSWIQGRPNDEPDPGAPRSAMEDHLKGLPTREGKLGRGSVLH